MMRELQGPPQLDEETEITRFARNEVRPVQRTGRAQAAAEKATRKTVARGTPRASAREKFNRWWRISDDKRG